MIVNPRGHHDLVGPGFGDDLLDPRADVARAPDDEKGAALADSARSSVSAQTTETATIACGFGNPSDGSKLSR